MPHLHAMRHIDSNIIQNDNTILSAAICSHAAYAINSGDVEESLREWSHFSSHTFEVVSYFNRILVARSCGKDHPPFLVVHTHDTTFIAFCGPPSNAINVETFSSINPNLDPSSSTEVNGYSTRVKVFDHIPLACLAQGVDSRRIIFCGHSLGGVMAHAVLLQYFLRTFSSFEGNPKSQQLSVPYSMYSIAFGSPNFCDASASRWLETAGLSQRFITVINGRDPIPNLFQNLKLPIKIAKKSPNKGNGCATPNSFHLSPWLNVCEIREEAVTQKFATVIKKIQRSFRYISSPKMHKKPFFSTAGAFIHLDSNSCIVSKTIPTFSSNVQITHDSLHQHMLLGTCGYASQIMQQYLGNSQILKAWEDKLGTCSEKKPQVPLVMQPMPFIESATLDNLFEGGRPSITLYGRNLFYLTEAPVVFRESSKRCLKRDVDMLKESDSQPSKKALLGYWKVISYSNAGTSLRIVLDTPYLEDMEPSEFQDLKVEVVTAFGIATQSVVAEQDEEDTDRFMACNMWTECVDRLSEIRKGCIIDADWSHALERCLHNLFLTTNVEDQWIDERLLSLEKMSALSDLEYKSAMDPLTYGVLYYVGKQWAFEIEKSLIRSLTPNSGFLQFESIA